MSIKKLDGESGFLSAVKQRVLWSKTGSRTLVALTPYSVFDLAGDPGAGVLAIGDTAAGLVPTDATAGYPTINTFSGRDGYLGRVYYGSSVAERMDLYDRLFAAGAYAFNADITLAAQPSFVSRVPLGGDGQANYAGLELWVEAVTVFTGTPSVQVNYLDQDGEAGDTGAVSLVASMPVGRCYRLPLAAGDSGVRQITRVRGTVATVGTFNVMVLRPLWMGKAFTVNAGNVHGPLDTGFPKIYDDSALYVLLSADSTAVGLPVIEAQIATG
jgi:hypothetical protein